AVGCDDFIRKPYREQEILDALARHLGVRFRREDEQDLPEKGVSRLDAAELKTMPTELVEEFREAVELLDGKFCLDVINRISDIDLKLGERLRRMVVGRQYRELLRVLDAVVEGSAS
ncbi:MAG: hypothetical protein FJY85_22130, partial [Deltaproteobacteria bacterium]|nr:hypothetical protein [Deltaproteobacteria bacterium]